MFWARSAARDYIRAKAENEQIVNNIITSVAFYESTKWDTEIDLTEYVLWQWLNWSREIPLFLVFVKLCIFDAKFMDIALIRH